MSKKRRGLSAEDRALWEKVTSSVTPRNPDQPKATPKVEPDTPTDVPKQTPSTPPGPSPRLPAFKLGERSKTKASGHNLAPNLSEQLNEAPMRMDRKAFGRMKKGKLEPEARIDLHGLTQAQAHPALTRFIQESYARGFRLVLVITGKGKERDEPGPMPIPRGVLKHQVPHWLASGPLRLMVLQVTEAHLRHGGTGAYYVYLRRHR